MNKTQIISIRVKAPAFPSVADRTASLTRKLMTGMAQSSPEDGHVLTMARSNTHKSCTSNVHALNIRAGLKVTTWNVLTLNQTGFITALVRTLRLQRISLVGITEARLTGTDSTQVEGATVLHSGGQQHVHGVCWVDYYSSELCPLWVNNSGMSGNCRNYIEL
jgi:hypothetical protein